MKNFLLLALVFTSFYSTAQKTTLSGEIKNSFQDWVYVRHFVTEGQKRKLVVLDSAKINDGKYAMEFQLDQSRTVQFYDGNEFASVRMNPGDNIKMNLNANYFDETIRFHGDRADVNNMMVNYYLSNERIMGAIWSEIGGIAEEDTSAALIAVEKLTNELKGLVETMRSDFPEIEDDLVDRLQQIDGLLERIPKMMKNNIQFSKMEKSVVGQAFLDATGTDLAGKEAKISDFYGKPVVLDFWATWCGPCMYEMPFMGPIEETFEGKVNIVAVAVWDDEGKWSKKAPELGFSNNIFLSREQSKEIQELYMINGIPRYMLLDAKGNVVSINAERPSGGLKKQLEDYLEEIN